MASSIISFPQNFCTVIYKINNLCRNQWSAEISSTDEAIQKKLSASFQAAIQEINASSQSLDEMQLISVIEDLQVLSNSILTATHTGHLDKVLNLIQKIKSLILSAKSGTPSSPSAEAEFKQYESSVFLSASDVDEPEIMHEIKDCLSSAKQELSSAAKILSEINDPALYHSASQSLKDLNQLLSHFDISHS